MDISTFINSSNISIYLWIILFIIVCTAIKLFMPKIKGHLGEAAVGALLQKLDKEKYSVINDVMLNSDQGNTETTQIDHVVVSIYGIFSVETKNYKGEIYGSENSRQWTQNIYGHKYQFMNPVHQNYAHVKALEALLNERGYKNVPVYSIVAFPGDTTLKVKAENSHVVKWGAVPVTIRNLSAEACLTKEQVNEICALLTNKKTTHVEMREHVADIRKVKMENVEKTKTGVCPRCGGELVLRNGKHGKFYGCSNFPKCRFTEQI